MNSPKNIWSDLPISAGIATFVCYAGVFRDVIAIKELAARLGRSGQSEFNAALNEMSAAGRLIVKDGFAGLPNMEGKVPLKVSKIATAREMISSRLDALEKLGRNPLIEFVGVSGSLAAANPTKDRNNALDIDVFMITRKQSLWLYNIWHGLEKLFQARHRDLPLCVNYIMDESDMLIANRNLYTATEIRNLVPIAGWDTYRKFLQVNSWVDYYYPGTSGVSTPLVLASSAHRINKVCYTVYNALRGIKWCLKGDPLKTVSGPSGHSFNVMASHCGGYQGMVQKKFSHLAEIWFPELVDADLIEKLFPDKLSEEIRTGELDVHAIVEHVGLGLDYGKYG